jgi:hypothetical protein
MVAGLYLARDGDGLFSPRPKRFRIFEEIFRVC